ncbi:MAG: right-handed parallel beta-helix repeat-containing protein, partial [Gemmataceae bacterium]|nr:right-handed parallel beta-helix repeat-containing protein [Gemmataceae bacterium]
MLRRTVNHGRKPFHWSLKRLLKNRPQKHHTRLGVAPLDDRCLPAVITVTSYDDVIAVDGKVTLREALTSANNNASLNSDVTARVVGNYGTDTIVLDPTVFKGNLILELDTQLPTITGDLTLQGPVGERIPIGRSIFINEQFPVFVSGIPGVGNVTFSNVWIDNGSSSGIGSGVATGDDNFTATDCNFTANWGTGSGGAIGVGGPGLTGGTITLKNCSLNNNRAKRGGGVYFFSTGKLLMENCTVSGNKSSDPNGGGGLYFFSNSATIRNTTITHNTAAGGRGAGIAQQGSGSLVIQNSTVAFNTAATTGGGLHRQAGTVTMESTLLTKNTATGTGDDIQGAVTATYSLVSIADNGAVVTGTHNLTGTTVNPLDALLSTSDDNGGYLSTCMISPNSPAVDAGSNPAGLTTDQRGGPFPRQRGAGVDIGAVEAPTALLVTDADDTGPGSLRYALLAANGFDNTYGVSGHETITFDAAFFAVSRTITLTSGALSVADGVTLVGPGAGLLTVDGGHADRVFDVVTPGLSDRKVDLSGVRITGGSTSGGGGGVHVGDATKLTLSDVLIDHCQSTLTGGGGVSLDYAAELTLRNCAVSDCSGFSGGAIAVNKGGTLMLENLSLCNNQATLAGGGAVAFAGAALSDLVGVRNSTISGNTSAGQGGGIFLSSFTGTLQVDNSTIVKNSAKSGSGGGIGQSASTTGTMVINSTIVSGNSAATAPDISSPNAVSLNFSALGAIQGSFAGGVGNVPVQPFANLKLVPLGNFGGLGMTHPLLAGSPCLNTGSNALALSTDQRGVGFDRSIGFTDIGAFEAQPGATLSGIKVGDGTAQRSNVTSITLTFDKAPAFVGAPAAAFQLQRAGSGNVGLSASVNGTAVTLTFSGPLTETGTNSLIDGTYNLTILADQFVGLGFDGNNDGIGGDNYTLVGDAAAAPKLFRLFGDADGNGQVTSADFLSF